MGPMSVSRIFAGYGTDIAPLAAKIIDATKFRGGSHVTGIRKRGASKND